MKQIEILRMENVRGGGGDPTIMGVCAALGIGRAGLGIAGLIGSTIAKTVAGGPVGIALLVGTAACIGYTVYHNY